MAAKIALVGDGSRTGEQPASAIRKPGQTIHQIIRGGHIVDYVAHDDDDGAWQFLNRAVGFKMADAMLVGLSEMVKFDGSLRELWDLPYGWCAWREGKGQPWHRARKEPEEE